MPDLHQPRRLTTGQPGGRSAMRAASDGLPWKPYTYGGESGPVIGSPAWHAERSGANAVGPGAGWDPVAAHELATGEPAPLPEPEPAAPPARRHKACGYPINSIGHKVTCDG